MTCVPSEDSDQPGHLPSLLRVFAVRSISYGPKLSSCGIYTDQTGRMPRLISAQSDLSLRWAHMPFCWFCHEPAHMVKKKLTHKKMAVLKNPINSDTPKML